MNTSQPIDILLVEDNPADAELTVRAFNKVNLANRVFIVDDGVRALDFLFRRNEFANIEDRLPKVVLLDLKLPRLNGLEVLQALRNNPLTHALPVVIVTSSSQDPDIQQAYDLGVNSYVVKPVDFDQFVKAMSTLGFYWLLVNQPLPS
jgi:two-component system, response regulator